MNQLAHAQPILKWLGGKRWITDTICDGIHQYLDRTGGRYFEPFMGGGAVALDLGIDNMMLSDSCEPLMITYDVIRRNPDDVIRLLDEMAAVGMDKDTYYAVRAQAFHGDPIEIAAMMIYLNKLGYNGVFRVNKSGGYNVPYGNDRSRSDPASLFNYEGIHQAARALATAEIGCADFRTVIEEAGVNDVIFADPPYASTFASYSKCKFTSDDQDDLADRLFEAWQEGAVVLSTNANHPDIHSLYEWATVTPTEEARSVNRDGRGRDKIGCVLISSPQAEVLLESRQS